jgi:hypothetical protein
MPLLVGVVLQLCQEGVSNRRKPVEQQLDRQPAAGGDAGGVKHLPGFAGLPSRIQTPVLTCLAGLGQDREIDLVPHQDVGDEVTQGLTRIAERPCCDAVWRGQGLLLVTVHFFGQKSSVQLGASDRFIDRKDGHHRHRGLHL